MAAQYKQCVDESHYVYSAQLVPGLRGRALPVRAWEDPLAEHPLGGFNQVNNGFKFKYQAAKLKTFTPSRASVTVTRNGRFVKQEETTPYSFKARPIGEINTRTAR